MVKWRSIAKPESHIRDALDAELRRIWFGGEKWKFAFERRLILARLPKNLFVVDF